MFTIKLNLGRIMVLLIVLHLFSFVSLCYCQITEKVASDDRKAILEKQFPVLKDELERNFPREEVIEKWSDKVRKEYPSLLYMIIMNSENKLVNSFFREGVASSAPALQKSFQAVNKLLMKEETFHQDLGGSQVIVSHEKLVIEMDTYYFEFGFGPIP